MPGRQQEFDNSGSRPFFRKGSRSDVRFVVMAFDFRLRPGPFEGPATVKASGYAGGSLPHMAVMAIAGSRCCYSARAGMWDGGSGAADLATRRAAGARETEAAWQALVERRLL